MVVTVDPHIPGYRVERLIGSGGMASVYLAIQESLERPVALKVLDDPESAEYQERFLNEGRIIASLIHTNIVTVHDIGIAHRHLYISMEYVEGGDLRRHIRQGIAAPEAFEIVEKIGNALKLAHDRGVVHRDVKPANILFRTDSTPLLADFGIAKDYHRDSGLTLDGSLVGSPYYLSPEQARAHPIDGRADIYSLGIILYEMLTGVKPFKGESAVDTVFKHLNDPVPTLPEDLVRLQWILDKMLAKEPGDRFTDAGELVEAVRQIKARGFEDLADRIVHGTDTVKISAQAENSPEKPRRGFPRLVVRLSAMAAAVAGLAIGGWLYLAGGQAEKPDPAQVLALSVTEPPGATAVASDPVAGAKRSGEARSGSVPGGAGDTAAGTRTATGGDGIPTGNRAVASAAGSLKTNEGAEPAMKKVNLDSEPAEAVTQPSKPPARPKSATAPSTKKRSKPPPKPTASAKMPKSTASTKTTSRSTSVASAAPPAPPRKSSRELEIERLLRLGQIRLDEGKLTMPTRDSALYYRDEVLALDPSNWQAHQLGADIVGGYVELAESTLARGEYLQARDHIDRGLEVDPGNQRLRWLRDNAFKQSVRGFINTFQRSLTTPEPKAKQRGVRPDN